MVPDRACACRRSRGGTLPRCHVHIASAPMNAMPNTMSPNLAGLSSSIESSSSMMSSTATYTKVPAASASKEPSSRVREDDAVDQQQQRQAERRQQERQRVGGDVAQLVVAVGQQVDQAGAEEHAAGKGVAEREEPPAVGVAARHDRDGAADQPDRQDRDGREHLDGQQAQPVGSFSLRTTGSSRGGGWGPGIVPNRRLARQPRLAAVGSRGQPLFP